MENSAIKRLGRYEILAELGRGAMGVVYKARDPQIDRFVALKTVSLWGQEPDQEAEFRLRFINEAQAAGRLHHPGIVSVFDMGENPENRDPYIVLEYVSGESLNKILHREKKLPLPRALKLAEEIADALDYAHTQGVVHRDIKPANILINETGNAKIADFGIAKLNLAHFTLPGRVLGTPAYMAPEQLSGEGADGRSDLFSLGVILYTMVTGHSPFQGNSATTVCFKVANREPVAASALDLTLPADIDAIIARAMAKLPEERYQRGAEFAADLRILQQPQGTSKSTTSRIPMSASGTTLTGTSSSATGANPASAAALADVKKVVNHIRFKAPIRDLVLGAATIVGLVIVGVQSKLLVTTSRTASPVGPVVSLPPATSADSARLPAPDDLQAPASDQSGASIHAAPTNPPVRTAKVIPAKSEAKKTVAKVSQPKAPTQIPTTMLDLTVQHQFKDATLFVWIDDKLALTRPLHGAAQKKLVVFNDVRGVESDSLKVPAGRHVLRFRALSSDQTIDLSKTISADFVAGDGKSLQITFDKRNSAMKIAWQ
ncbi:MAG TPA: protein kinase [Candidatus Sulfotelmatobacter sp.]|nr:protein kinase [Candidatus Sulfotelmatobacter sp.]